VTLASEVDCSPTPTGSRRSGLEVPRLSRGVGEPSCTAAVAERTSPCGRLVTWDVFFGIEILKLCTILTLFVLWYLRVMHVAR
jgi:hypothetical protein